MDAFVEKTFNLVKKTIENNRWRQEECINLIPSETTPSILVRLLEISDPSGRYAEHRTMKGKEIYFYQGIDFIKDVEIEVKKELIKYFNCNEVDVRPISGQMANMVAFNAMLKFINRGNKGKPLRRMTAVMNNELTHGGHLSSQPMGALFNCVEIDPNTGRERTIGFPVRKDNPYKTDITKLDELIKKYKPELIIFGKSMFIYPEPVKEVYDMVKDMENRPVIMYDMAHTLGLYGAFQKPFDEGADILTGSTHKTFFGPQRGVIATNFDEDSPFRKLWIDIKNRAFPGATSNHHLGTLLALLLATIEMNQFKDEYQSQVIKNAKSFARSLKSYGIDVEGDESDGYTKTHQVLIRVKKYDSGEVIAKKLEENNIIANYQALPDDESFINCSGIRLGVQEMTRFGMTEKDFDTIAGLMAEVIVYNKNVKDEVKNLRKNFLKMKFCLPDKESIELTKNLLNSIYSNLSG
ncbi:hypothetical protein DRQ09_00970 [candidate division KSB1 bacterium]|nr:MAG: hypothetical protein DRQ09_00970 [candidate division KSB1 bacterium]